MTTEREAELGRFALHLIANSIREEKERIEQHCTCDEYWHYPLDHNATCPVALAALKNLPNCEACKGTGKKIPN